MEKPLIAVVKGWRSLTAPVLEKVYNFDETVAKTYLSAHVRSMTNLLNHPSTVDEFKTLSKAGNQTPAFYKNVRIDSADDGGMIVIFTEPTISVGKKDKKKLYYGANMMVIYDKDMHVSRIDTISRDKNSHVSWQRVDSQEMQIWDIKIINRPENIRSPQRFAKDEQLDAFGAVLTFIDRLGTNEVDTRTFERSSPYVDGVKRLEILKRRGIYDRAQLFADTLLVAPLIIGGAGGFLAPQITVPVTILASMAAPESETIQRLGAGTLGGLALRGLTGCETKPNPSGIPITDLTDGEQNILSKPFEPNTAVPMHSVNDVNSYSQIFLDQINQPITSDGLYARLGFTDVHLFDMWVSGSRINNVTGRVLGWMQKGSPESRQAGVWQPVLDSGSLAEHQEIIEYISNNGINGDAKLLGYFDLNQTRGSNILRQGIVIDYQNSQYFLKVQPIESALKETNALVRIRQIDPNILTSDVSVFKLDLTPRSKLSISVSKVIVVPSENGVTMAPTLESYLFSGQQLTPDQLGQLSQIYKGMLKSFLQADRNNDMVGADVLKPANIVVDSNGKLILVDGFSNSVDSFATIVDGKIVISQADPKQHLVEAKKMMIRLGVSKDDLTQIEKSVIDENNMSLTNSGSESSIKITNPADGTILATAKVTNDTPDPIAVPAEVPLPVWVSIFGTTLDIAFGTWVGSSIYKFALPFNDNQDVPQLPAGDYERRGIDASVYMTIADAPYHEPYKSILRAHTLHSVITKDVSGNLETFRAVQNLRSKMNLPSYQDLPDQIYARQLIMTSVGTNITPETDGLSTWVTPDMNDQGFSIFNKQPFLSADGSVGLYLNPQTITWDQINNRDNVTQRNLVVNFDAGIIPIVTDTIYGRRKSSEVFNSLQKAVDDGIIDFYTVTDENRIVFGYVTKDAIETRYLAAADIFNNYHVLRSITINELINK